MLVSFGRTRVHTPGQPRCQGAYPGPSRGHTSHWLALGQEAAEAGSEEESDNGDVLQPEVICIPFVV
jgi:hypothetical protein